MKNFISFVFVCFSINCFSQTSNEFSIGSVYYKFSHVRDTLQPTITYTEDMVLSFSQNSSIYKSYSWYLQDSTEMAAIMSGRQINTVMKLGKYSLEQWWYNFKEKVCYRIQPWLGDTLAIKYDLSTIEWELIDSTKRIGSYLCSKAVGRFKGRDYYAWYTTDMSTKSGPWKLNGLPGTILEACDSRGHVKFEFIGFRKAKFELMKLSNNYKLITTYQYSNMVSALTANPSGYISNGTNGQISLSNSGIGTTNKKKINNPLELE